MKQQLKFKHAIIVFFVITNIVACKSSSVAETGDDSNSCTEYSCPVHQDKVFVSAENCPDCGLQMIHRSSIDSLLNRSKRLSLDSLDIYHKLIVEQSDKIMMNDTLSKEEQIQYLVEATKNLNKAKTINENLNQQIHGKQLFEFKPKYKKLERLYAIASYRITSISDELSKKQHDKQKIKLYAKELKETIYEVDKEQHRIRVK